MRLRVVARRKRRKEPGDCWREPNADADGIEAWAIVLPNGAIWNTTDRSYPEGERWTVTGEAPNFTVEPSINIPGERGWHGRITNGEAEP